VFLAREILEGCLSRLLGFRFLQGKREEDGSVSFVVNRSSSIEIAA
jgi:hypothetical protein